MSKTEEKETILLNGKVHDLCPVSHQMLSDWFSYIKEKPLRDFKRQQELGLGKDFEKELFKDAIEEMKKYTFGFSDMTLGAIDDSALTEEFKERKKCINKVLKDPATIIYILYLRIKVGERDFELTELSNIGFLEIAEILGKAFPREWSDNNEPKEDIPEKKS